MNAQKKIALIGCGAIAPIHLQAIRQLELASELHVCDINPAAAASVAEFQPTAVHTDWRRMLETVRPDALHICTPHFLHPVMTEAAVDLGIPVLSEKPAGASSAECRPLLEKIERTGATVGICFQNRFNSFVLEARRLLAEGAVGRLKGGTAQVWWSREDAYYKESPWRGRMDTEGVGVLCNQSIHTLDLVLTFFGFPSRVDAISANWTHADCVDGPDTVMARMVFDGAVEKGTGTLPNAGCLLKSGLAGGGALPGASVLFSATNSCACNQPTRIDLICENAVLTLEDGLTIHWKDGRTEIHPSITPTGEKAYWGSGHLDMIRAFHQAADTHGPVPASWADGVCALACIEEMVPPFAG